uniref:At5g54830-like domain-containing protein n=1 Tax=Rhodnius prolixus TaxID=13249 RepID=T1HQW4_RHOPR
MLSGDVYLDFGRPPKWNCPIPEGDATADASSTGEVSSYEASPTKVRSPPQRTTEAPVYKVPPPPSPAPTNGAWEIPAIQCNEPEDGVFYAQMGPTGGKRGYPAITGHVGWGISYYINGLLIPEIHVVRGRTYTFVVEGGKDANVPAKFHPFYITDDPVGGYQYKTPEEKRKVNIYAGAELNKHGEVVPTGLGRLCNWTPDPEQPMADEYASFGAYQRTLTLVCDHGEPAVVQWTPDKDTPDTVYYQCFSHRYLGWKIHVHDRCDQPTAAGSEPVPSVLLPQPVQDQLQAKPSLIVTTRVKPDFPSQSIIDTKAKNFTKVNFPYEILKPAYNVKRPNISEEHIIPVKEDVQDIPHSSTTHKAANLTMISPTAMPLIKGIPFRNSFGNGNGRPATRRPVLMIRRPLQPMMKPPQPITLMNRPSMVHASSSQTRPVIVKKPLIRIPQRPMMMMQGAPVRPLMPQQASLMPNRAPMKAVYVHKFKKPSQQSYISSLPEKTKHKIQPSQMISQNAEELTTKLPIAVNTGFNPGSLVIESGFKPIIQTPHAEERLSDVEYEEGNEGVINMDSGEEQKSHTEMFEPMFIPSPLDSNSKHTKKATTEPLKKIRKPYRHIIVRRPIYTDEPLFRSEPDLDETTNDKVESYFISPTRTTFSVVAYDGKSEAEGKRPPIPDNHRPAPVDADESKSSSQFDPFIGDKLPSASNQVSSDIRRINLQPEALALIEKKIDSKENLKEVASLGEPSEVEVVTVINMSKEERRQRRAAHHEPGHFQQHDNRTGPPEQAQTNGGGSITANLLLPTVMAILAKYLRT